MYTSFNYEVFRMHSKNCVFWVCYDVTCMYFRLMSFLGKLHFKTSFQTKNFMQTSSLVKSKAQSKLISQNEIILVYVSLMTKAYARVNTGEEKKFLLRSDVAVIFVEGERAGYVYCRDNFRKTAKVLFSQKTQVWSWVPNTPLATHHCSVHTFELA